MILIPEGAVGALGAATVGAVHIAQTTDLSSENLLLQAGGVGVALGVGLYFIRRSDRRDDKTEENHQKELDSVKLELELERAKHDETRALLLEAIRELGKS